MLKSCYSNLHFLFLCNQNPETINICATSGWCKLMTFWPWAWDFFIFYLNIMWMKEPSVQNITRPVSWITDTPNYSATSNSWLWSYYGNAQCIMIHLVIGITSLFPAWNSIKYIPSMKFNKVYQEIIELNYLLLKKYLDIINKNYNSIKTKLLNNCKTLETNINELYISLISL